MSKRMTDTGKWSKPFLRTMKAPYKLLWIYILDECDHAGIWQVDFEVAQIKIGEQLNEDEALNLFEGKIFQFDNNEKWFIPDFIDFQYGVLQADNRVHNSVIKILSKYKLEKFKGLVSTLQGVKDKDKDKVKDQDKDKDNADFDLFWNLYNKKIGSKPKCEKKYNSLGAEIQSKIKSSLPEWLKMHTDKQFQPHPLTYLNNERWNDEVIIPTPKPQPKPERTFAKIGADGKYIK